MRRGEEQSRPIANDRGFCRGHQKEGVHALCAGPHAIPPSVFPGKKYLPCHQGGGYNNLMGGADLRKQENRCRTPPGSHHILPLPGVERRWPLLQAPPNVCIAEAAGHFRRDGPKLAHKKRLSATIIHSHRPNTHAPQTLRAFGAFVLGRPKQRHCLDTFLSSDK